MQLFHYLKSFFVALVLFAGLELLTRSYDYFWWFFSGLALFVIITSAYILRHDFKERGWSITILPFIYFLSLLFFHLFIPKGIWQHLFAVAFSLSYFFLIARAIHFAFPTWNWFFTYFTIFFLAASSFGLFFHLYFPVWAVCLIVLTGSFFLSYQLFRRAKVAHFRQILFALIISFILSQIMWTLSFLPVNYVTTGGVIFISFYVLGELVNHYFHYTLKRKIILEYIFLSVLTIFLIFLSTRWKP